MLIKVESTKDEIDSLLDLISCFEGDSIRINGHMQSKVKLVSENNFTSETNEIRKKNR